MVSTSRDLLQFAVADSKGFRNRLYDCGTPFFGTSLTFTSNSFSEHALMFLCVSNEGSGNFGFDDH